MEKGKVVYELQLIYMPEVVMNTDVTTIGLEDDHTNQGIHIADNQKQQYDEDHRLEG